MGFLDRFRRRAPSAEPARGEHERHLTQFITTRRGVEGFVEPRTTVSDVTLLLVAHDGEWTRRRVRSVQWAHSFANRYGVPSYDAAVVGVPTRMREYNRRQKQLRVSDTPLGGDLSQEPDAG